MADMPPDSGRAQRRLFVVRLAISAAELAPLLRQVEGAAFVRELPPDRVVVSTTSPDDEARLAALTGVLQVLPDRLERLAPEPESRVPRHRAR